MWQAEFVTSSAIANNVTVRLEDIDDHSDILKNITVASLVSDIIPEHLLSLM